jgi:cell division protein FtsQ
VGGFSWALGSVFLAAALWVGYRAFLEVSPFVLQSVRIDGAVRTERAEVTRVGGLNPGQRLFQLDLGDVRRGVEKLPWVRTCRVSRRLPTTLEVELGEWQPRFLVRLDRLYYLTREAHMIRAPLEQGLDFPVITGLTQADLERASPVKAALLELFRVLEQGVFREELSEINADPAAGFTLYTPSSGGSGIRLGRGNFAERLDRLARLRRHLDRRSQAARSVDLTYRDKIVARLLPASGEDSTP